MMPRRESLPRAKGDDPDAKEPGLSHLTTVLSQARRTRKVQRREEKRKRKEVAEQTRRVKNLAKGLTDLTLVRGTRRTGTIQCQDTREELEAHLKTKYSTLTRTVILAVHRLHAKQLAMSTSAEAPHSSGIKGSEEVATTTEALLQQGT